MRLILVFFICFLSSCSALKTFNGFLSLATKLSDHFLESENRYENFSHLKELKSELQNICNSNDFY